MKALSIGQVAKRTGVRTSALRYYEDEGVLPSPQRVGGRRVYDTDLVRRIDILRFAQQAGFTLDEIRTLFRGFGTDMPLSARWQRLARAKLSELEEQAKRIERMRTALKLSLECGCVRIEECSLSPTDVSRPSTGCKSSGCT
ncbi:MAG TPA: MerR family transcriptional regulator [Povalibacter sp.]|uniref:MerR family transcriptional regulator n=1 Tax=Povalibacter sp. TaxID=1962978 RepID=UPI002CDB4E1B|nr:MerR family transcriptional regulator [Povalibacter sp.]HMN43910.1 MerR family transcriptional regulator [Povalibacter sp.]